MNYVAPHFSDEPLFTRFIGGQPPPSSLSFSPRLLCAPAYAVWPGVAHPYLLCGRLQRVKKRKQQTNLKQKLDCELSCLEWFAVYLFRIICFLVVFYPSRVGGWEILSRPVGV